MEIKRLSILIVLILIFLGGSFFFLGKTPPPYSKISIKPSVWNLGKVAAHKDYKKIINVSNNGKALLILEDIRSTCGCAVTRISTTEILPSRSADLEITFNEEPFGETEKKIYITSNDPGQKTTMIKIIADVR